MGFLGFRNQGWVRIAESGQRRKSFILEHRSGICINLCFVDDKGMKGVTFLKNQELRERKIVK